MNHHRETIISNLLTVMKQLKGIINHRQPKLKETTLDESPNLGSFISRSLQYAWDSPLYTSLGVRLFFCLKTFLTFIKSEDLMKGSIMLHFIWVFPVFKNTLLGFPHKSNLFWVIMRHTDFRIM